jgi:hypothetical protein
MIDIAISLYLLAPVTGPCHLLSCGQIIFSRPLFGGKLSLQPRVLRAHNLSGEQYRWNKVFSLKRKGVRTGHGGELLHLAQLGTTAC